jgi:hypothetical protein
MAIDKSELDKLLDKSKVGTRTRKALHVANGTATPKESVHGPDRPHEAIIDEL